MISSSPELYINNKTTPDKQSQEYKSFWQLEKKKIEEGLTLNGVYIPGELYWHMNFWMIETDEETSFGIKRKKRLPDIRDNDWLLFEYRLQAKKEKKGLLAVGSRRWGKSVSESSIIGRSASIMEGSQNIVAAGNQADLTVVRDLIELGLRELPEALKWQVIEGDWRKQVTLGIKTKSGEKFPFSYILPRNLDDGLNTEAIAGTTPSEMVIEEGGKFGFLRCLEAAIPGFQSPYGWRCSPLIIGTGGSFERGEDAEKIFHNPEAYNFLAIEVKDEPKKYGLFLPGTYRQDAKIDCKLGEWLKEEKGIDTPVGSEVYNIPFKKKDEQKAIKLIEEELARAKKAQDQEAYLKAKMYFPLTPQDCFLSASFNMFNSGAALAQKQRVLTNAITGKTVFLEHDGEKIVPKFTDKKPISSYPHKNTDDLDAPIVIWEMPTPNPSFGDYVAGCLIPGEKVITNKGLVSVEDVTLEDKLINEDGVEVGIDTLIRHAKFNIDTYKVKVANAFRTTTFTGEHPILTSKYKLRTPYTKNTPIFNFEYKKADELKKGDWIKVPNIYKTENTFDILTLWDNSKTRIDRTVNNPLLEEDFWWFVGLFLGDGWCESDNRKISMAFNTKETLYIERYKRVVKKLFNREVSSRDRIGSIECAFSSPQVSTFLTKHFGKYAYGKCLPVWAKKISNNLKKQLILGYLDSDGCIYKHPKGYSTIGFVSINLELLEDFQDVLFSLGIISNLCLLRKAGERVISDHRVSKTKKTYQLRIGHNDSLEFVSWFEKGTDHKIDKCLGFPKIETLKRPLKGCFFDDSLEYIYFQVADITKDKYTGVVYNFECETNTFMCKNITTHNCDTYRQSEAKYSDSLGTVYIFKRLKNALSEKFQDMLVASYAARPKDKSKWEEQAMLLIEFYNARTLVENDEMSFIETMKSKGKAHLFLERQPNFLKEWVPNSEIKREYGIHRSSEKVREHLHKLLKDYMEEVVKVEMGEDGAVNKEYHGVTKILDPMLLEEIAKFTPDRNVDRIVAFELALCMAKHLDPYNTKGEPDKRMQEYFKRNEQKEPGLFGENISIFGNKSKFNLFKK